MYKVNFPSANGGRVYGWYTKPAGPGPFPALLVYSGIGNCPRPAPVEHARHGYAALDIQMHGNDVDLPVYQGMPEPNYSSPASFGDYAVYRNALQAARAIVALPGVDASRVSSCGGSQGGRLAIIVAALMPHIRATIPAIANFGYVPWLRWVERCNSQGETGAAGLRQSALVHGQREMVESYYDCAHFAPHVKCPVLMNAAMIDSCSPITTVFAIYRQLTSPKSIVTLPNLAHDWSPYFDRYAWSWLADVLAPRPASNERALVSA